MAVSMAVFTSARIALQRNRRGREYLGEVLPVYLKALLGKTSSSLVCSVYMQIILAQHFQKLHACAVFENVVDGREHDFLGNAAA